MSTLPRLSNYQLVGHTDGISSLALGGFATPFHHTIASGGYDSTVNLWDTRVFASENRQTLPQNRQITGQHTTNTTLFTPAPPTYLAFGECSLPNTFEQPTRLLLNSNADESSAFWGANTPFCPFQASQNGQIGPKLIQNLFESSQHAFFCAVDNVIYQYDLRNLPSGSGTAGENNKILAKHVAISTEFGDSVGFLTISPDGRQLAVCSDDNSVHYIPLVHAPELATCVENEENKNRIVSSQLQQNNKFAPSQTLTNHTNIPTSVIFDPYSPIRIPSNQHYPQEQLQLKQSQIDTNDQNPDTIIPSPYINTHPYPNQTTFTNYSAGMDYNIITNTHSLTQDPLKTPLTLTIDPQKPHPTSPLTSLTPIQVKSSSMTGQVSNPPFINQIVMGNNSGGFITALGDGTIGLYALDRTPYLPLSSMSGIYSSSTQSTSASGGKSGPLGQWSDVKQLNLDQYLTYLDATIGLYSSGRAAGCFNYPSFSQATGLNPSVNGYGSVFLGNYRGHMHSVVGASLSNFLQTTQNSQMLSKLYLSTLTQSSFYHTRLQQWQWEQNQLQKQQKGQEQDKRDQKPPEELQQSRTPESIQNSAHRSEIRSHERPRPPKNPYTFSSMFHISNKGGDRGGEFFDNGEKESFSSLLRSTLSQNHYPIGQIASGGSLPPVIGVLPGGSTGKGKNHNNLHDFGREFNDFDNLITVGLDQTLVMWTGLDHVSKTVYNVARSQELNSFLQSGGANQGATAAGNNQNTKNNTKKSSNNTTSKKGGQQPTTTTASQGPRYNYAKLVNGVMFDLNIDTPEQLVEMIEKGQSGTQNYEKFDETNCTDQQYDSTSAYYEECDDVIEKYNRLHLNIIRTKKDQNLSENLISGMYKKTSPEQEKLLDNDHVKLRVPLVSKPNAVITDRVGFAYVADGTKKLTAIALMKE